MLEGKKIIAIGDKDGISAPAIEVCLKSAGAEVIFLETECYSCRVDGSISNELQEKIISINQRTETEKIIIVIGIADAEFSKNFAENIRMGNPIEDGPLRGIAIKVPVYHILEKEIKIECDPTIYEEYCGIMELILDVSEIAEKVKFCRI